MFLTFNDEGEMQHLPNPKPTTDERRRITNSINRRFRLVTGAGAVTELRQCEDCFRQIGAGAAFDVCAVCADKRAVRARAERARAARGDLHVFFLIALAVGCLLTMAAIYFRPEVF